MKLKTFSVDNQYWYPNQYLNSIEKKSTSDVHQQTVMRLKENLQKNGLVKDGFVEVNDNYFTRKEK